MSEEILDLNPYCKHDEELVTLLTECIGELHTHVKFPYLCNLLTDPRNKNLTLKELLTQELEAKKEFEGTLKDRSFVNTLKDAAHGKKECDEDCAVHAPDCDGYCDHLEGHINACMKG